MAQKKKSARLGTEERRRMIEKNHPQIPVARQCELLGLPRSTYYHQAEQETELNQRLMHEIDETYLAYPYFGSRQMTSWLRLQGHRLNRKRIQRLMRLMSLEGIAPSKKTSAPHPEYRVFPYLIKGLQIVRPNQVWGRVTARRLGGELARDVPLGCACCLRAARLQLSSASVTARDG